MSRSFDRDDNEVPHQSIPSGRMVLSQGRSGGSSETDLDDDRKGGRSGRAGGTSDSVATAELIGVIEQVAAAKPTMSAFVSRLEERGVQVIPSIQSSGRLNGMSYQYQGTIVKGSSLGRQFTASGLQERLGVAYESNRDDVVLRDAVARAGFQASVPRDTDRTLAKGSHVDRSIRVRDSSTGLSRDQELTLTEVGKFRTVEVRDLVEHRYQGRAGRFSRDLNALSSRGLAERRTVWNTKSKERFDVVVLTKRGRRHLSEMARSRGQKQEFHAGFVKPAEVRHDLGIYRMYQAEAAKIEKAGGTITRVTLDFELKRKLFSDLNKPDDVSRGDKGQRKREVGETHDVRVIDGRFVIPDLRIEYETEDREPAKVDLELATGDYKASQVQAKHSAGLKIYAPDSALGSPALKNPELISGLISF
jgi:hypothetical protein